MILEELSTREVATATPDDPVSAVAATMKRANVGAVVVTRDGKIAGIVTDRDIALAVATGETTPEAPVSQVMTTNVKTIWSDQGVFNATQYFLGHKVRRLPVIDRQDNLVGIVSVDDLLQLLVRELFNVSQSLEPSLGGRR